MPQIRMLMLRMIWAMFSYLSAEALNIHLPQQAFPRPRVVRQNYQSHQSSIEFSEFPTVAPKNAALRDHRRLVRHLMKAAPFAGLRSTRCEFPERLHPVLLHCLVVSASECDTREWTSCSRFCPGAGLAGYDLITFTGAPAATSAFFMGETLEGARVAVRCDNPLIQLQAATALADEPHDRRVGCGIDNCGAQPVVIRMVSQETLDGSTVRRPWQVDSSDSHGRDADGLI
jgi:hypothetical protein